MYGEVVERGRGPLRAGFNYLWSPPSVGSRPDRRLPVGLHRRLLAEAAGLLGDGAATVVDADGLPMLCLSRVVALGSARPRWSLDALGHARGSAVALVESLALAAPSTSAHRFLIGLWMPEYGYLNTGELIVDLRPDVELPAGQVEVWLTGVHQPLLDETRVGPFAHSMYFEFSPNPRSPTGPWPWS
jgi:hypothetical protein